MTTLTDQDYAYLSSTAYDNLPKNNNNKDNLKEIPEKSNKFYFVHLNESDPKTGFQGYLLEKADADRNHTGEFITVFRGSTSAKDWEGNMRALTTGQHLQTSVAMNFANKAQNEAFSAAKIFNTPYSMVNTGHSLGGAEAQLAHLVNGAPTVTFNTLPATLLKDEQGQHFQFPPNSPIKNHVMAMDIASSLVQELPGQTTMHFRTKDKRILKLTDYYSEDTNNPKWAIAWDTMTRTSHSLTNFIGKNSVLQSTKYQERAIQNMLPIQEFRHDVRQEFIKIKSKGRFEDMGNFLRWIGGEYEGNDKTIQQKLNTQSSNQPTPAEPLSPKAQNFAQQCEEKLIDYCQKSGITADSPQDFKNIALALTVKGMESGMTKIENIAIEKGAIYILSHEPQIKMVSIVANDAVNIPASESISKIQQIENQSQERQITQTQNRSISLV